MAHIEGDYVIHRLALPEQTLRNYLSLLMFDNTHEDVLADGNDHRQLNCKYGHDTTHFAVARTGWRTKPGSDRYDMADASQAALCVQEN